MKMFDKVGKRWQRYVLSAVPFILGVIACVLLGMNLWRGIVAFDNSLVRLVMPGERFIDLPSPGKYTIFNEYRSVVKGVVYSSSEDSISGMRCEMTDIVTNEKVPLKASSANMTYSFGSKEGRSVYDFDAGKGGTFRMNCSYQGPGREGVRTVIAIGRGFGGAIFNMISYIFAIISIFIVSFGISAAAFVYLIVKKPKGAEDQS